MSRFFHVLVCNAVLKVRRMKAYPFLCLLLAVSLQSSLRAGDSVWPGWLGPERNGRVKGFDPPDQWPAELKPKWSVQVGSGYGTAVVSDGKVMVHSRQGEKEMVRAIDLVSGKVLWTKGYPAPFKMGGGGEAPWKEPQGQSCLFRRASFHHEHNRYSLGLGRGFGQVAGGRSRESVLGNRMPIGGRPIPL